MSDSNPITGNMSQCTASNTTANRLMETSDKNLQFLSKGGDGGNGGSGNNVGGGGTTSPSCVSSLVSSSHFPSSLSPTGKFSDFSSGTFSPRDFHGSLGRDFSSALGVGMAAVAGAARHHQHHHHHHPTALDRYPYLSQVNQT